METETETETVPSRSRRGVAMMVVLGLVIFFTMLGFMGLEMATKDSQVSGTLLDIKSKESAAWGGLNLALGAMASDPANTAAQLQKFIADSSKSAADKRRWFLFSGGGFSLQASEPDFFAIGSAGDRSGIKVRLVSLDINGSVGIVDGSGIPVTLECTGQGRNGQQLKIIASYRMLGIDVPTATTVLSVPNPANAFYLNGTVQNLNSGLKSDGGIYSSGGYKTNSNGCLTVRSLRVGGDLNLAGSGWIAVDSNSYIAGSLTVNTGFPLIFGANLGIGGGIAQLNDSLVVRKSLNIYGVVGGGASWGSGSRLVVRGQQFYFRNQPLGGFGPGCLSPQGPFIVSGNAFFDNAFTTASALRDSFYGTFQVRNRYSTAAVDVGGPVYAGRALFYGSSTVGVSLNTDSFVVVGDLVLPTSPLSFTSTGSLRVGGSSILAGGVSNWGNGSIALASRGTLSMKAGAGGNPGNKLDAWNTVTVNGTVSGVFGRFNPAASGKTFRCQSFGSPYPSMTGQSGPTSGGSGFPYSLTVPAADAEREPKSLLQLGYSASDTDVSLASNPPDTIRLGGPGTTDWSSKIVNIGAYKDSISPAVVLNSVTGAELSAIYSFVKSRGLLSGGSTGYMFLRIDQPTTISTSSKSPFVGKAVFIVDASVDASYNWPASSSSSDYQVIYVPMGSTNCGVCSGSGSLSQFGTFGPFYGYLSVERTQFGALSVQFDTDNTHVVNWYGALSFGFNASVVGSNQGGTLNILKDDPASKAMFADLATIGILHTANGGSAGGGGVSTSTRTLTVRSSAGSLQFVRIGEFR